MNPDPRQAALAVLNRVEQGPHHLDRVIRGALDVGSRRMGRQDRNLANELIFGVLRWRNRLDWFIGRYSSVLPPKIDPAVLNILRIGIYQLMFLDRVPESAAVNTSVELAKPVAPPWVVRYVNGLLRTVARHKNDLPALPAGTDTAAVLAVMQSFPEWLVRRWIKRFGPDEARRLCEFINRIPAIGIRTNTLKTDRDALLVQFQEKAGSVEKTKYSPDGLVVRHLKSPLHELVPFGQGHFQVQDEAAQLISCVLSPQPGEHVLDACAGLGGKTGHMAQLMQNAGSITALDSDPGKLTSLAAEMVRLGVRIVSTRAQDLAHPAAPLPAASFDRILLDAPCSGLGVIRRDPDIKWDASRRHLGRFRSLQVNLLNAASDLLKPGGTLVYAVCSLEAEENEGVVTPFLEEHPQFHIADNFSHLPFDIRPFLDQNRFIRTWPHKHQMDGFFCACLKKA